MREGGSSATEFEVIFGFVPSLALVDGKGDLAGRELVRRILQELVGTFKQCESALAKFVTDWGTVDLTDMSEEALLKLQSEQAQLQASLGEVQSALVPARQSARHFGYVAE